MKVIVECNKLFLEKVLCLRHEVGESGFVFFSVT